MGYGLGMKLLYMDLVENKVSLEHGQVEWEYPWMKGRNDITNTLLLVSPKSIRKETRGFRS